MDTLNTDVPVILLGGQRNTLAVARNLGNHGIRVVVSGKPACWGLYSKHCADRFVIPREVSSKDFWRDILLTDSHPDLSGAIVFAMNDDAIEFLVANHKELRAHYILDDFDPEMYSAMLDKIRTLELAKAADVPTPRYWSISGQSDLGEIAETVEFPAIVKPVHTHLFAKIFGVKLFIANDADALIGKAKLALEQDAPFMIVEMVPGPDTSLKGYYTYITKDGQRLYEYTHSVIRRYPTGWGVGCCHHAKILPDVAEAGRKFLAGAGFQGFANIEFKQDPREGQLKVIEVNTRFTAPHEMMVQSGMPLDLVIYCYLTGQQVPHLKQVDRNMGSWLPIFDFLAYRELSKRGEITLSSWLADVLSRRQVLNVFKMSDPLPSLKVITLSVQKRLGQMMPRRKGKPQH